MSPRLNTHSVEQNVPAGKWCALMSPLLMFSHCRVGEGGWVPGSVRSLTTRDLDVVHASGPAQRLWREQPASAATVDYVFCAVQRSGRMVLRQDNRELEFSAGDLAIFDTRKAYLLEFPEKLDLVFMRLPRQRIIRELGHFDGVTACCVDAGNPLGNLVATFLQELASMEPNSSPGINARLVEHAVQLIELVLQTGISQQPAQSAHRRSLVHRAKRYIEMRLPDAELTLAEIAREIGVSTRYVNDLFTGEGTSCRRYIARARLERCAATLRDPKLRDTPIQDVAFSWGFLSLTHFSSAFKKHFGLTPTAYRLSWLGRPSPTTA